MTRFRPPFLWIVALTGVLALSSCQKNPEAAESQAPAASTEPAPGGISTTSPPAENTPPAETPPPQSSTPANR